MADNLSQPLEAVRAELQAASTRARNLIEGIPAELAVRRPDAASWSPAECIAHLTLTTEAYLPELRKALAEARGQGFQGTHERLRMDLVARLLAWWLEPPYRMKAKTPASLVPGAAEPAKVLADFLSGQQTLLELLGEANELAIDRLRIESPFARQMRYSVYSAFRLIAVHQRRHLWQAEQFVGAATGHQRHAEARPS